MSDDSPNRAIQLTPPGAGAIAIVRITGDRVTAFLQKHFSRPVIQGRCVHGQLTDGTRIVDDPVVVLCDAQTADINLHGGTWVVHTTLELARENGFQIIEVKPANIPAEAFDANTEIEREVLQSLPQARTELAVRALLAQPAAWLDLENRIAVNEVSPVEIQRILDDRSLTALLSLPRVAIVGPANVGKSTLANQLFGQDRSITADLPGTTRDWVGEIANIDGLAVMLVDTPGQRETADSIEIAAISASETQIKSADLVLLVLDQSAPLNDQHRQMLNDHRSTIVVANKSDHPYAWPSSELSAIETVATSGAGLPALRQSILRHFSCHDFNLAKPQCWTNRQANVLPSAIRE